MSFTIVAWAGVGKSTLVNHWLRRMAAKHYRSAELVFGWSFYRQGTSGGSSSADEFLDAALSWFGEGPELSVLRMLGLFDRPANEKAFGALLRSPAIRGLTESLTDLSPTDWRTVLARLRRARLLAAEDPQNPRHLESSFWKRRSNLVFSVHPFFLICGISIPL